MPSLWFVVPAHGRAKLAAICLRQLRRTCDLLIENGIDATAVVVATDGNLRTARSLGFETVREPNRFVSRKFNAGIQAALDERHNAWPADYVVPFGSDDWVDYRLLLDLPGRDEIKCFQTMSFVREDGREMTPKFLNYLGGCGIRVYPREVMARLNYRPADEDRTRGCDTSILTNLSVEYERNFVRPLRVVHAACDARQIVDWKSQMFQLNAYDALSRHKSLERPTDPFVALHDVFPSEALDEMAAHYGRTRELVAA
jgi:glycosyltransferase involved in cell wall biosynthesis